MTSYARETELPSGLRVITLDMPRAQSVALGLFADVGSRDEAAVMHGASHALEHMVFKGAGPWDVHALSERLDALGGNANAFTSRERTCFHMQVLHESWAEALELLAAMVCSPHLPEEEWEKEREVIYSEMAMVEDAPEEWVMDQHVSALFPDHALGRSILGTRSSLATLHAEDLRRHLEDNYGGSRLLLAAAGNIRHESLVDAASAIHWRSASARTARTAPSPSSGVQTLSREGEQAHLLVSWPCIHAAAEERPLAWLANQMLGGGMSSHLFREVREKRGLAYSIASHLNLLSDVGTWGISCSCSPEHGRRCIDVLREVLQAFPQRLNERDLRRAKSQLRVQLRMGMDSVEGQMLYLGSRLDDPMLRSPVAWTQAVDRVELDELIGWVRLQLCKPTLWTVAASEEQLPAMQQALQA
ncbi:MAG: insulinase family protein [Zetaproteobacteria bacterium]|nr:MAG: insulinase family protein [Zetaproteobacteria bacterium]